MIHMVTSAFQGPNGEWLANTVCGTVVPEGEPISEADAGSDLCVECETARKEQAAA